MPRDAATRAALLAAGAAAVAAAVVLLRRRTACDVEPDRAMPRASAHVDHLPPSPLVLPEPAPTPKPTRAQAAPAECAPAANAAHTNSPHTVDAPCPAPSVAVAAAAEAGAAMPEEAPAVATAASTTAEASGDAKAGASAAPESAPPRLSPAPAAQTCATGAPAERGASEGARAKAARRAPKARKGETPGDGGGAKAPTLEAATEAAAVLQEIAKETNGRMVAAATKAPAPEAKGENGASGGAGATGDAAEGSTEADVLVGSVTNRCVLAQPAELQTLAVPPREASPAKRGNGNGKKARAKPLSSWAEAFVRAMATLDGTAADAAVQAQSQLHAALAAARKPGAPRDAVALTLRAIGYLLASTGQLEQARVRTIAIPMILIVSTITGMAMMMMMITGGGVLQARALRDASQVRGE